MHPSSLQSDTVTSLRGQLVDLQENGATDGAWLQMSVKTDEGDTDLSRDGAIVLVVFLPSWMNRKVVDQADIACAPDVVLSSFGATLAAEVQIQHKSRQVYRRILLASDSAILRDLRANNFTLVFAHKSRVLCTFTVDWDRDVVQQIYDEMTNHVAPLPSPMAHYWFDRFRSSDRAEQMGLSRAEFLEQRYSDTEQLSIGWVVAYNGIAESIINIANVAADAKMPPRESDVSPSMDNYPNALLPIYDAWLTADFDLNELVHWFTGAADDDEFKLAFLEELVWYSRELPDYWALQQLFLYLYQIYLIAPGNTNCGRGLAWHDLYTGATRYMPLECDSLSGFGELVTYWSRFSLPNYFVDWGYAVSGADMHVDPVSFTDDLRTLANNDGLDPDTAFAAVSEIFAEACEHKKRTVPPKAVVQFPVAIGSLVACEVSELGDEVFFVLRDAEWRFAVITAAPSRETWSIRQSILRHYGFDAEEAPRVLAQLQLLLAAIVRDFWVVEERKTAYQCVRPERSPIRSIPERSGVSVVYLPRCKYLTPKVDGVVGWNVGGQRSVHDVRGHLRKSAHASSSQQILAKRYGIHLPDGFTYVRPHRRGDAARERVYRSRSALNIMYELRDQDSSDDGIVPKWERFERDVFDSLDSLGFEVLHTGRSRCGDNGIDVYAIHASQAWLVQCKCYSIKYKVGPAVVRELVGTLTEYDDARGMIVTTSSFTAGARRKASEHGVVLIEGEDWVKHLKTML